MTTIAGAPTPSSAIASCDPGKIRGHHPLPRKGAVGNRRRRRLRRATTLDQPGRDSGQILDRHQQNQRPVHLSQRIPVHQRIRMRRRNVPRHHRELVRHPTMRHRNPGNRRYRDRARDPRHDRPRHPSRRTGQRLLEPAPEDVRIPTLEPYDDLPLLPALHQDPVDLLLLCGPTARQLRRIEQLHIRMQLIQQLLRRQPIRDHHIRLGQQPPPAHGDQIRIARPATNEVHPRPPIHLPRRQLTGPQPLEDRVPYGGRPPVIATAEHTDRHVVVLPRRRRPRGRTGPVVGSYAEDPPLLRLGRHLIVDRGIIRRHHDVPGAVQVAGGVPALDPGQRRVAEQALDRRRDRRRDEVDLRPGLEQPRQPPLGDTATADDDHAPPFEDETGQVLVRHEVIPASSNVAISASARTAQVRIG